MENNNFVENIVPAQIEYLASCLTNEMRHEIEGHKQKLLTRPQLAEYLNVSVPTIARLIEDGIPVVRVRGSVRFDKFDVLDHLKQSTCNLTN